MRPGRRPEPDVQARRAPAWAIAGRVISILLLGVVALVVVLRVTAGGVFAESRPAVALAWAPDHAVAQASLATRLIGAGRVDEGRRLATNSLRRNPINVAAVRNLATAAAENGDRPAAGRLFALANRMSRRDRPTQIWLIRQAFQNGDFEGGVRGFDLAMRTSVRAAEFLGPIVVAATADRRTLQPLARALDANPAWRPQLLRSLVEALPNPDHVAWLVRGRLDLSVPEERTILLVFLDRLVRRERFDLAWAVYRDFAPGGATASPELRDAGFEQGNGFIPFDWGLAEEGDLAGLRAPRPDGRPGVALSLIGRSRAGVVARQLVRMAPGRYRISFEVGSVPAASMDRPQVAVNCASGGRVLGEWRPSSGGDAAQYVAGDLLIPPACHWQWLTISVNSGAVEATSDPWIDNLAIRPLRAPTVG